MQKPKSSHTDVRFEKRHRFTLIELLVVISQHCRDFFKRFICTDVYGNIRKMPLSKIRRIILAKQVLHVCRTLHAATLRFTRQSRFQIAALYQWWKDSSQKNRHA